MVKELRLVQIKDIIPYTNNPRKNKDAVAAVKSSISEYGYKNIIAVDENMVILAGHTRLSALKELGWKECNVLVFDDLTEAQKKGYRIVDNKTNEFSFWDDELLKLEFDSLKELDFDLSLTGFSTEEINKLNPVSMEDAFGKLPTGEKSNFEQITFTLEESQAQFIRERLTEGKNTDTYKDGITINSNTNGTSIWAICKEWDKQKS